MTASSMAWAFPVSRSATIIMCFAKRLGIENVSGNDRCRKSLESRMPNYDVPVVELSGHQAAAVAPAD